MGSGFLGFFFGGVYIPVALFSVVSGEMSSNHLPGAALLGKTSCFQLLLLDSTDCLRSPFSVKDVSAGSLT